MCGSWGTCWRLSIRGVRKRACASASRQCSMACEEWIRSRWDCGRFLRHWRAQPGTQPSKRKEASNGLAHFQKGLEVAVASGIGPRGGTMPLHHAVVQEGPRRNRSGPPTVEPPANDHAAGQRHTCCGSVHVDAIPGVRQDWLVRPIKRRDLLAAKLLFVILLVQGPILLTDFVGAAANGFPFAQSLSASLSHNVFWLATFYLPVLAFASLTRNFTEAVA